MKHYHEQVALHFSKIPDWSYLKLTSILLSVANCYVCVASQLAVVLAGVQRGRNMWLFVNQMMWTQNLYTSEVLDEEV
jgi:hypothetical protein